MTYNVFGGTLNVTQLSISRPGSWYSFDCSTECRRPSQCRQCNKGSCGWDSI